MTGKATLAELDAAIRKHYRDDGTGGVRKHVSGYLPHEIANRARRIGVRMSLRGRARLRQKWNASRY